MGNTGGDLGYHIKYLNSASDSARKAFETGIENIATHFNTFVTTSNPQWKAVNAKKFFESVATYVQDLNKDIKSTGESFLNSLGSAGDGWKEMTGNSFSRGDTSIAYHKKAEVKEYDDGEKDGRVFMTEECETEVGSAFETFTTNVKTEIENVKNTLGKGELIGGGQSEGFIAALGKIGIKFEEAMNEQREEMKRALKASRLNYELYAKKVAAVGNN